MISVKFIENAGTTAIADWLEEQLCQSLNSSTGMIKINVPGGSTPFPIMEDLVSRDLDWTRIAIFPGDDRIVSENHKASNTGKIRAIFEPRGAVITPLTPDMVVPEWALSWLGMGADGHIASLFLILIRKLTIEKRCVVLHPSRYQKMHLLTVLH